MSGNHQSLGRRDFLRKLAVGATGAAATSLAGCGRRGTGIAEVPPPQPTTPPAPTPEPEAPSEASRVVIARHSGAHDAPRQLNRKAVEELVDFAVTKLSGESDVQKAWEQFFGSDDVVGIKVGTIGRAKIATEPLLVAVVAERLQAMGIAARNIVIWDRNADELRQAGYELEPGPSGVQCTSHGNDWDAPTKSGVWSGRFTRWLTQYTSALINMPVLKDHGGAGITCAMKNHYGSINNPGRCHGNNCDPYIADINAHAAVTSKTRLILADATRVCWDQGPVPSSLERVVWAYSGILCSQDPVALDYQGWQIIEAKRAEAGAPSLEQTGRLPKHIASAAARGLGTDNPEHMDIIDTDLA
ncbi:MAG: DUF362 domain-containing protein [Armatimonadota bacterium]